MDGRFQLHGRSQRNRADLPENAEEIWGKEVLPAYQWASSDAKYYRELGIPTIQYGPANTPGIHSYNEDVDCEDVAHAEEIYVLSSASFWASAEEAGTARKGA